MGKNDYVPRRDAAFQVWAAQFETALGEGGTALGLSEPELLLLSSEVVAVANSIRDHSAQVAAQQAATAGKKEVIGRVMRLIRGLAQRIKKHPTYTVELGERLGIVAPESTTPVGLILTQPTLVPGNVTHGEVVLRFVKRGYTGVEIYGRRGGESEFVRLGRQLRSPYVDTRVNLGDGPETRHYRARFLRGDVPVGELSDVVVVTVPE